MKYFTAGIVFSEIPDEVTLELGITNCPFRCEGCHSPFLQKDIGIELTWEKLKYLIHLHKGLLTCVLFSGGDADYHSVEYLCKMIKDEYPELTTAWYSGREELPEDLHLRYFDYIKLGPYKQDLGGLKSRTTNQRLYYITDGKLLDVTDKFWK
jgi:anaerobic ribonucleoside-triphosphate reductase activating protein